jgi:hypothetical protein
MSEAADVRLRESGHGRQLDEIGQMGEGRRGTTSIGKARLPTGTFRRIVRKPVVQLRIPMALPSADCSRRAPCPCPV